MVFNHRVIKHRKYLKVYSINNKKKWHQIKKWKINLGIIEGKVIKYCRKIIILINFLKRNSKETSK